MKLFKINFQLFAEPAGDGKGDTNPDTPPNTNPGTNPDTNPNPEPKTYTEAEMMAEVDRRVSQAVETTTKRVKAELKDFYETEAKKNQSKTAEERVQELLDKHTAEMNDRERKANIREAEVELKKAGFSDDEIAFYTAEVTHDRETSMSKIYKVCEFRKTRDDARQKEFDEKMAGQFGKGYNSGNAGGDVTLEQFKNMSLSERIGFKNKNPELYETFKKQL